MFEVRRGTRSVRVAVMAIYTVFSLFGGMFHTLAHHGSGGGCVTCHPPSDDLHDGYEQATVPPLKHASGHSHCHACHHTGSRSSSHSGKSAPRFAGRIADCDSEIRSGQDPVAPQMRSANHACSVCDKIVSLLQSWSAPICEIPADFHASDRCCEPCSSELTRVILVARSRGPPARI
jgi:hypothetical protein